MNDDGIETRMARSRTVLWMKFALLADSSVITHGLQYKTMSANPGVWEPVGHPLESKVSVLTLEFQMSSRVEFLACGLWIFSTSLRKCLTKSSLVSTNLQPKWSLCRTMCRTPNLHEVWGLLFACVRNATKCNNTSKTVLNELIQAAGDIVGRNIMHWVIFGPFAVSSFLACAWDCRRNRVHCVAIVNSHRQLHFAMQSRLKILSIFGRLQTWVTQVWLIGKSRYILRFFGTAATEYIFGTSRVERGCDGIAMRWTAYKLIYGKTSPQYFSYIVFVIAWI